MAVSRVHAGIFAAEHAQLLAGAEQAGQHRRVRQAEFSGDFRGRIAHQHLQHQRLAILVRQLEQGRPQFREILIIGRRRARLLLGDQIVHIHRHEALAFEGARILAADDGQKPGLGGALRPAANPAPSRPAAGSPARRPRPARDRGTARTQNAADRGAGTGTAPGSGRASISAERGSFM